MAESLQAPEDCKSIDDIRQAIDQLDREIIQLIGKRGWYVRAAARFKTSASTVRDDVRVQAMLTQRRAWAEEQGLSPEMIEQLYRQMVEHFTQEELMHWYKGCPHQMGEE